MEDLLTPSDGLDSPSGDMFSGETFISGNGDEIVVEALESTSDGENTSDGKDESCKNWQ